jgi:hypothetical protein
MKTRERQMRCRVRKSIYFELKIFWFLLGKS